MAKDKTPTPTIVEINAKLAELNVRQLRILAILLVQGQDFQEAYEVAKTYEQNITE